MLHKVKASHGDILKGLPELAGLLSPSDRNKRLMLEMARRGEPRPKRPHRLAQALANYTNEKSPVYDLAFTRDIKRLAPHWIELVSLADKYKTQLLDLASRKKPKPKSTSKLGLALRRYTDKKCPRCDHSFRKNIKKLAPEWLVIQTEAANSVRERLLRLARKRGPKPLGNLGKALYRSTKKGCTSYNLEFVEKIKKIAPHWLLHRSQITEGKKNELLKMARRGEPKPDRKTPLGNELHSYLCESSTSYDSSFKKKIGKAAPSWVITKKQIVCGKKEFLLDMARRGKSKPRHDTKIADLFYAYTSKKSPSYDPAFTRKIKRLAPNWLVKPSDQKKKELLKMARSGEPKPLRKHPLGLALVRFTYKKTSCYDPAFAKEIKKLAPHWLRSATQYEIADRNREKILEIARKGRPRPSQRACRLGRLLCNYLKNTPGFAKEIKRLAPHWFRKATL